MLASSVAPASMARCPLCATGDAEVVYDLRRAQSAEDIPGLILRCRACRMWFKLLSDPQGLPTSYPGEAGDDEMATTYLLGVGARSLFRQALSHVVVTSDAKPRLLDIGAGQGTLLQEAQRQGFEAAGIDHCEANVQRAQALGFAMQHGAAEDLDERARFDVITLMDIIEHVVDPMRVLSAAYRALKPGGEVVVYTPNHRAAVVETAKLLHRVGIVFPVQEIFGRNHVCFFDDRTLPLALRKAGFQVRLKLSFPYDPSRPGQHVARVNLAGITLLEWLGKPFGRVFRLLYYARKVDR